jgi:RNase P subunit RPR2
VVIGISLAESMAMEFFCKHCEELIVGRSYRVVSEEDGVILLDMTVCHSCYKQARALGLYSEPIPLGLKPHNRRGPSALYH